MDSLVRSFRFFYFFLFVLILFSIPRKLLFFIKLSTCYMKPLISSRRLNVIKILIRPVLLGLYFTKVTSANERIRAFVRIFHL